MRITIEGASEEFGEKLLALIADHRAELAVTVGTEWTVERAEFYLRDVTAGARQLARRVVDGDGRAEADALRAELGDLGGHAISLSRVVPRGVRVGWWPEGTEEPVFAFYGGPESASWRKVEAYLMSEENLPVFREAFARIDAGKRAARSLGLRPGGTGKTTMYGDLSSAFLKAYPGVTPVDLDGDSRPADDDQEEGGAPDPWPQGDAPSALPAPADDGVQPVPPEWAAEDDAPQVMLTSPGDESSCARDAGSADE